MAFSTRASCLVYGTEPVCRPRLELGRAEAVCVMSKWHIRRKPMNQSSYGRVPETHGRAGREGDGNVPGRRELRRRGAYEVPDGNNRSWAGDHEGALLGALALALGAGALVAWY